MANSAGMAKPLVSDELWSRIEPVLPVIKRRSRYPGRKRIPDRAVLTGILFVLKTGIPWEDLPQEMGCGSGMTCWRRPANASRGAFWGRECSAGCGGWRPGRGRLAGVGGRRAGERGRPTAPVAPLGGRERARPQLHTPARAPRGVRSWRISDDLKSTTPSVREGVCGVEVVCPRAHAPGGVQAPHLTEHSHPQNAPRDAFGGRRLAEWNDAGVWNRLHQVLLDELQDAGQLDWSCAVVDSSHVRAKGGASRPGPRRSTAAAKAANTT